MFAGHDDGGMSVFETGVSLFDLLCHNASLFDLLCHNGSPTVKWAPGKCQQN